MDPARKLVYVGTLPPHQGGSAVNAARILAGLASRGWSVRAIGPVTPEQAAVGDPFAAANSSIAVTRFPVPYEETNAFDPAGAAYRELQTDSIHRELRAALDAERADVVVIGRESFVWGIAPIARAYGAATVQLAQGLVLTIASGTFPSPELGARLLDEIGGTDLVIAAAHHMAATIRGLGIGRCAAVPNGVDPSRFRPQPKDGRLLRRLGISDDAVLVLHASNLNPVKRPLDLVALAAQATAEEPRLVYLVAGDGPCRQAMEAACRKYRIVDRFRFVGWVDPSEMPRHYSLADVVAMPSQSECLALAYLETQACARTLLASDIPAAREVVSDDRTGVLFRTGDVDDLARKTLMLASDPALRARIGRDARAAAARRTVAGCVDAYADALATLIAR